MPRFDKADKENLYRVVCRPALPKDSPDVIELTRTIWEGEDYVPSVWNEWLSDPNGLLAVAEFAGIVIGLSKLTKLSEKQWWLEGLRVHPAYEGRGIASQLHNYLMKYWEESGAGIIRLVTAAFRKPVHHLALRSGFQHVCELTLFKTPVDDFAPPLAFKMVGKEEIAPAIEFIRRSHTYGLTYGLIDLGWQWASFEPGFLSKAIQRGQVWWWRERAGLLMVREDEENHYKMHLLQLLACSESDVSDCLTEFKRLGIELDSTQVGWFVPPNPDLVHLIIQAGYRKSGDISLLLFEKRHITLLNLMTDTS